MKERKLMSAGIRQHRGVLTGILLLNFMVIFALGALLTVWNNSGTYIDEVLDRIGYGDVTVWVSGEGSSNTENTLEQQIKEVSEVAGFAASDVLYVNYEANGEESDSEGLLIKYSAEQNYRFFKEDLSSLADKQPDIQAGEVYVSPSLVSMMDIQIGDEIEFVLTRNSGRVSLTVKGYYEDPMMGSSMIGMKGFLISDADYEEMKEMIDGSGIDALGRIGQMFHITADDESMTAAELLSAISEKTNITEYLEFSYSHTVIKGFMLVLQNAFSGFLLVFVLVLFVITLIVLGHSIHAGIESDYENIGILKTMGASGSEIRKVQLGIWLAAVVPGMFFGAMLSGFGAKVLLSMTVTSSGLLIPAAIPWHFLLSMMIGLFIVSGLFIWWKTRTVLLISPMAAIRGEAEADRGSAGWKTKLRSENLSLSIAIRQVTSRYRKYVSICLIAVLLVFFAQMVVRMNSWLGSDGKGLMDAFNPAEHDIGVQMFGNSTDEDARNIILSYTGITDSYELAMPDVTINGTGYTANVITDPSRFHILSGETCKGADEIVITEFIASDYGVGVGDTLVVTGDSGSTEYRISGIYSCANDMGDNIGMSAEAYLQIGRDDARLWCHHYFLENTSLKYEITDALEEAFGGDVHVHENTWPGLFGIISAMHLLISLMIVLVVIFVLVTTVLTGTKLLEEEKKDIGIYKALGFSGSRLRKSFAIRFGLTALAGSVVGTMMSSLFADSLISSVMKLEGISNFAASPSIAEYLLPGVIVTALFSGFAWSVSRRISCIGSSLLINE